MVLDPGEQAIHDEAHQVRLDSYIEKLASQETIGARFQMLIRRLAKRAIGVQATEGKPSIKTLNVAFKENREVTLNSNNIRYYEEFIERNTGCVVCPNSIVEDINEEFRGKINESQQIISEITTPKPRLEPVDIWEHLDYKPGGWLKLR